VIQKSSDDTGPSVRITFTEPEGIGGMVEIEFDLAGTVLVLFPLFETFKTVFQCLVID
jgi:hypothetical protein